MIDIALLGTGGMMPLPRRWLSSLLVRVGGDVILFDCGEGTQIAWRATGWSFRRLSAICISHTHSDHIAGLPGLLHTVANTGRTEPITIFGPVGLAAVVQGLRVIAPQLPFPVEVRELTSGDTFPLPEGMRGACMAGEHALPVLAYRLDLARRRRFLADRARSLLDEWTAAQLARSGAEDPIDTVLAEGGPYHTRGHLPAYLQRLRDTGRSGWADLLAERHAVEADPGRWADFESNRHRLAYDLMGIAEPS